MRSNGDYKKSRKYAVFWHNFSILFLQALELKIVCLVVLVSFELNSIQHQEMR